MSKRASRGGSLAFRARCVNLLRFQQSAFKQQRKHHAHSRHRCHGHHRPGRRANAGGAPRNRGCEPAEGGAAFRSGATGLDPPALRGSRAGRRRCERGGRGEVCAVRGSQRRGLPVLAREQTHGPGERGAPWRSARERRRVVYADERRVVACADGGQRGDQPRQRGHRRICAGGGVGVGARDSRQCRQSAVGDGNVDRVSNGSDARTERKRRGGALPAERGRACDGPGDRISADVRGGRGAAAPPARGGRAEEKARGGAVAALREAISRSANGRSGASGLEVANGKRTVEARSTMTIRHPPDRGAGRLCFPL